MTSSIVSLDQKRNQRPKSAKGTAQFESKSTLAARVTRGFLDKYVPTTPIDFTSIHDDILYNLRAETALINAAITTRPKSESPYFVSMPSLLDEQTIVTVLQYLFRIVRIDLADGIGEPDFMLLAIYEESGPLEGTYNGSDSRFRALIRQLEPALPPNLVQATIQRLHDSAPDAMRTREPHLIPVQNGVFNHLTKELLPFSSDWVFLNKLTAAYNPNAQSPQITNSDGTLWDFDNWIRSLSDDPEIVQLLWEVISAATRPFEHWNRAILLAGPRGGGGKGTLVTLLQNLLGPGRYSNISLTSFGERFATTPLLKANVNLVHENDVDAFSKKLAMWKACITGDTILFERKGKDPYPMTWRGLDIQCFNSMTPRIKDRSGSVERRLLIVPMTKRFHQANENLAIKEDYLGRTEVLEYVLKCALEMRHTKLSEPVAVKEAVGHWFKINNKAAGFWEEYNEQFQWDLLPWNFLYDLFVADLRKKYQGSTLPAYSRDTFVEELRTLLEDSDDWEIVSKSGKRPGVLMHTPEPLIDEYDLKDWGNGSYTGSDPNKRCVQYPLKAKYYGLVRKQPHNSSATVAVGTAVE